MTAARVCDGYRPGVIARLVGLHMAYYAPVWGFGLPFESKLAAETGAFFARFDADRDLFLAAWSGDDLAGAVTIDGADATGAGHLRWFIVADAWRGRGLGAELLARALATADARGCPRLHLTTFAGLDPARRLYERFGFALVAERADDAWSGGVGEQRFERPRP